MNKQIDYYSILKIEFNAPKSDITSAYRRLVKVHHPDVSREPDAEDKMKEINLAYSVLSDDTQREAYNRAYVSSRRGRAGTYSAHTARASQTAQAENAARAAAAEEARARDRARRAEAAAAASAAVEGYFQGILSGDYEKSYHYLSDFDKQYVTLRSFCEWRKSVRRLFDIREFSIVSSEDVSSLSLKSIGAVAAKKHYINVIEKNIITQATDNYKVVKQTVRERGSWHVLLGYRDLNEIAKIFEKLSAEQEKNEMEKHWEQYCADTCRELGMLSLSGFLKEASREVYRYKRYKQQMTVACFKIVSNGKDAPLTEVLEPAARAIMSSIRVTDIAAYLENGAFAVLFVELKKRNADAIVGRLTQKIESEVRTGGKRDDLDVLDAYAVYTGEPIELYIEKNLEKIKEWYKAF